MTARRRMTHRCDTTRNVATGSIDSFTQAIRRRNPILREQACYWQSRTEVLIVDTEKVASVAVHLIILPLGTDIRAQDLITGVRDRRGNILYSDNLRVVAAIPREDHIEATLEVYH